MHSSRFGPLQFLRLHHVSFPTLFITFDVTYFSCPHTSKRHFLPVWINLFFFFVFSPLLGVGWICTIATIFGLAFHYLTVSLFDIHLFSLSPPFFSSSSSFPRFYYLWNILVERLALIVFPSVNTLRLCTLELVKSRPSQPGWKKGQSLLCSRERNKKKSSSSMKMGRRSNTKGYKIRCCTKDCFHP